MRITGLRSCTRPDVKVGLADPRFDAVGYRALMVYALAGDYYRQPASFTDMFKGQFTFPLGIFTENDLTTITVPEILETKSNSHIVLRGASIELIALLESGDLDYAFEYESVINQHKLNMLALPAALNLGEASEGQFYSTVRVDEAFQRFASVEPIFRGERIGYGITIPSSAPHPEEAARFISFLLSAEGRTVMKADNHPTFDPPIGDGYIKYSSEPAVVLLACGGALSRTNLAFNVLFSILGGLLVSVRCPSTGQYNLIHNACSLSERF